MSVLSNSASSYICSAPSEQWTGSTPCRFKGGRKHDNHPIEELDNLLIGNISSQTKMLGPTKRRIVHGETMNNDSVVRPHLRTYQHSNKSNIVLGAEQVPRLIKIPRSEEQLGSISPIYRVNNVGESKMKKLQNGTLKSGIYRNFYKSQFKQQS